MSINAKDGTGTTSLIPNNMWNKSKPKPEDLQAPHPLNYNGQHFTSQLCYKKDASQPAHNVLTGQKSQP